MSTFNPAQQQAIAANGNVLVSAGAGTGKTRTVVERCLRLIGEGVSLENILMVTFTEAAAAEMRARIRKALEEARNRTAAGPALDSRPSTLDEQIALLDTAHISTLHSFCLQLVRDHFHELHIDPQVSVLDEAQAAPLLHQTLDALLDRCHRGELSFGAGVQLLIRQYGGGSDERIRALVIRLHRYTQTLPPDARWYEQELLRLDAPEPAQWREDLLTAFHDWREEWRPVLDACEPCDNITACARALDGTPGIARHEGAEAAQGRAMPGAPSAMAETLEKVCAADELDWPKGRKTELRKPLLKFFEEAAFLRSLVTPREGRDPLADDWNWMRAPMRVLLLLAQRFTEEFTQAKRALGGVDFADLEQLALQLLLDERGEPTAVAREWQARLAHVFVDECQDINAAQNAIIRAVSRGEGEQRALSSTAQPASSGNRFLVGDVKQSIYRFRLADPKIFRRYEEAWRSGSDGQRIPLADNFRSREGVLNFINPLFTALMRPSLSGVSYDEDARLRFGNPAGRAPLSVAAQPGPRVELHVLHKAGADDSGDSEENGASEETSAQAAAQAPVEDVLAIEKEARLVARRLRELRASGHEIWNEEAKAMCAVEWRDMVVLLRSPSSRVETFAKEFSRAGVPLAAARAGFFSAIEVLDLLNLLRLIDNPMQDIPLAAVLRSPLVGLSVDELATVRIEAQCDSKTPFFAAVQQFLHRSAGLQTGAAFAETARTKLQQFFAQFTRWRSLARQTSLSHCLETVLAETHYEALLLAGARGRERVANVNRLLELARQYDPLQRQGLYRFLRFVTEQEDAELDHAAAAVETANAVRLMSIHKSKGLEFPVVVLACLAGRFNTQDLREDILLSAEHGLCAKIIPPHIERRYPSLAWWLARRQETRELAGEEMRLLYVAMTRARDTLILTAFDKSKQAGARWNADGAPSLTDRELTRDTSYFAWLRRWLSTVTSDSNWSSDRAGETPVLRWEWHREEAPEFGQTTAEMAPVANVIADEQPVFLEPLRQRLTWKYPFTPVTHEAAKSNVSLLRQRAEDEEARVWFRPRRVPASGLNAADLGSAHHLFLQHVDLARAGSLLDLRNEAERLVNGAQLTREQVGALDFEALLNFWQSPPGREIRAEPPGKVHRELPFTARFTLEQLAALGLAKTDSPEEFVIVQGVVDLAVVRNESITILDFKTDAFHREELATKVRQYAPQLRLYASALGRIYDKPVTGLALHFLKLGVTERI